MSRTVQEIVDEGFVLFKQMTAARTRLQELAVERADIECTFERGDVVEVNSGNQYVITGRHVSFHETGMQLTWYLHAKKILKSGKVGAFHAVVRRGENPRLIRKGQVV